MRYLILLIFLSSCGYNHWYKRGEKKGWVETKIDTVTVHDTIRIEGVKHDTIFKLSKDTLIIKKDRLTIKHYISRDTVYLSGECSPDTIYRTIKIPVEKKVIKEVGWWKRKSTFQKWLFISGVLLILLILTLFFREVRKLIG